MALPEAFARLKDFYFSFRWAWIIACARSGALARPIRVLGEQAAASKMTTV
jgi:hypothetical protein